MSWPVAVVNWSPAFRAIPTRFPSIYLFDRVADAGDFEDLCVLEAMTNERLRDETGQIELVPPAERLFGIGTGPIMAAFTHLNPLGSRFSDGSYGIFYAGKTKQTAIAETRYHSAKFLAATKETPTRIQMRLHRVNVVGEVVDVRSAADIQSGLLAPDSYAEGQALGRQLKADGAAGLIYPSVRDPGGECVAALRTTLLRDCLHEAHLEYHWDGEKIDYVTQLVA
jgi:hypothetical protein